MMKCVWYFTFLLTSFFVQAELLADPAHRVLGPAIRVAESELPAYLFSIPRCLPSCTEADKSELMHESLFEQLPITAIRSAQRSIDFAQFTFSRKAIFEALLEAAERNIVIRGLLWNDAFSTLAPYCRSQECQFDFAPFNREEYLRGNLRTRMQLVQTVPLYQQASMSEKLALLFYQSPNGSAIKAVGGDRRAQHHKFVLVDDAVLVTGSGNWSSTAVSVNMENLFVYSSLDPVGKEAIQTFRCLFTAAWRWDMISNTADMASCQSEEFLLTPVTRSTPRNILDVIVNAIQDSKSVIEISMHHLVHPTLLHSLLQAAQRGVEVQLLADDDDCVSSLPNELRTLLRSPNVRLRYVPTNCEIFQLAHNKFGIFDRRLVINGSGNWSKAGLEVNFENFRLIRDRAIVKDFVDVFALTASYAVERPVCQCDRRTPECRKKYCLDRPTD